MIRKLIAGAVAVLLVLIAVVVGKALLITAHAPNRPDPVQIAIDEQDAAKRLASAVQFKTVSYSTAGPVAKDAFNGLIAFLRTSYPKVHEALEHEIVNDYSLLYKWQGSDPALKPVMLLGHMDVVPVEPGSEDRWEHGAFSGDIADGFIWGRGTLDDKVAVLGTLEAVEFLLNKGFTPKRTIYLGFGHDEEIGGTNGAAHISKRLAEQGVKLAFTLDEGAPIVDGLIPGMSKPAALIGIAEKGYLTLKLEARASGGHSSMPARNTAIGKLARAITRMEDNRMPARMTPPATTMFDYLAPEMSFGMRLVMANRWLFNPILVSQLEASPATNASIRTTTAVTMTKGGVKPNVLPASAEAIANFRIMPGDTVAGVIEHVKSVVDDDDVTVTPAQPGDEPSPVSDVNSWGFKAIGKSLFQVFPDVALAPSLVIAATDSKHYIALADNAYRFLPTRLGRQDIARIHGDNERISVKNYGEIIRFYIQLMRNSAG